MPPLRLAEAPATAARLPMSRPDEDGFVCDVAWPRPDASWPLRMVHPRSGETAYATFDPADGLVRRVRPEADPALPALRTLLARGRLVAYRPGRRATVRVDGSPPLYAKVVRPARAAKIARRHRAVAAAVRGRPGAPRVPQLIDGDVDRGVLVFREAPGRSLHEDAPAPVHERLAASLVALHRIDAAEADLPPAGPIGLGHYVRLAAHASPERAPLLRAALQEIAALPNEARSPARLVHGDLHDKNVLVSAAGITLLDVDLAHSGDPAEDVGNLAAHLVLRSLQRGGAEVGRRRASGFASAYGAAGGEASPEAIRRAGARTLLRLACLYAFRRRWRHLAPPLADEATAWAAGRALTP